MDKSGKEIKKKHTKKARKGDNKIGSGKKGLKKSRQKSDKKRRHVKGQKGSEKRRQTKGTTKHGLKKWGKKN